MTRPYWLAALCYWLGLLLGAVAITQASTLAGFMIAAAGGMIVTYVVHRFESRRRVLPRWLVPISNDDESSRRHRLN